jgi:hypothetical protein
MARHFDRQVYSIEIEFAWIRRRPKPGIELPRLTAAKQSLADAVAAAARAPPAAA